MTAPEAVLLRVAGLPARLWCAAGSPGLFAALRELEQAEDEYARLGARLADLIGVELVPSPRLTTEQRRLALAARRRLHRGLAPGPADHSQLAALAARVVPDNGLPAGLARARALAARLDELRATVAQRYAAARTGLAATGYESLLASPIGRLALLDGSLPVGAEAVARRGAGADWHHKQLRKRADYLWRIIARGAAKVTPRGWLGHVAVVPVVAGPGAAGPGPVLTPEVATHWTENLHGWAQADPGAPGAGLGPDTRVSLAPLLRAGEREMEVLAIATGRAVVLTPTRIRRTPVVDSLYQALHGGARTLSDLEAAVLPLAAGQPQRQVLRQFLGRLCELGLVQLRSPSRQRTSPWHLVADPQPAGVRRPERVDGGYLDVYRRASGALGAADLAELRARLGLALRLQALMTDDCPPGRPRVLDLLGPQDRPVLDVLSDQLARLAADGGPAAAHRAPAGWPVADTAGSGYARLLEWVVERATAAGGTGGPIDLDAELLDRFGAPHRPPRWPLDAVVRPLPDRRWVLDFIAPAGLLDARFVSALERLHGPLPQVAEYRDFLRRLEAGSGIPSVELLFPAMSSYAANAVRRPLYTSAWTGDPDLAAYCDDRPALPARFLPLGELTARCAADQVVISHLGAPVRPLYHSVRNAVAPWDLVSTLLLAGSPQAAGWQRRLRHPLTALPSVDFVPRITLGGQLVLSAAQWRLRISRLPSRSGSGLDRVRRVSRLREELGLPRWIFVSAGPGASSPLACDLESVQVVDVLDRMAAAAARSTTVDAQLVIEEMVPAVPELTVPDLADPSGAPVAAELMVRVPPGGGTGPVRSGPAAPAAAAPTTDRRGGEQDGD